MEHYVVIGGGLAGLTAANALADEGHQVTLLEQSEHLGGRARTQVKDGYAVNLGAHALYRGGRAARTFREWGVPFSGGTPATSRAYFVREGRLYPIVANLGRLATTRMFNVREKVEVAKLLHLFTTARAEPLETMATWVDRHVASPRVRQFAAAIVRVSTYAGDLTQLSAQAALQQVASALKENVLYLDGGWQTLVDGLEQRARSRGVDIRCGEVVRDVESIDATGIILAVGPGAVEKLTGIRLPAGVALEIASLDLGLDGMPDEGANVALAVDQPLYLSVHSASARLAPAGGRMVHVGKYLEGSQQDPDTVRKELEDYATLAIPRWKNYAGFVRFLPKLTVTPMMPGPQGRPAVDCLKMERVTIAGDWVGAEGMLADAAVASGLKAARVVRQHRAAAA
jgi:glycine/D-amino acid oxidase-like deaminating enzyme